MKRIEKILFIIFLLFSQWSMGQMSNYKSLYIYNFVKRIEWPNTAQQQNFVIVVMGDDATYDALQEISLTKKAGDQEIIIRDIRSLDDITSINLIYVDYSKRKHLGELEKLIGKQPILLVSDYKNSKVADITFMETSKGLEFIIRPKKIEKKGMKISDNLIQLGKQDE